MSRFYVPSYLDTIDVSDQGENWRALADSIGHTGPIRFKKVVDGYTTKRADMDYCLRLDAKGTVFIPQETGLIGQDFPIGSQLAVLNATDEEVTVEGVGSCVVLSTGDSRVINKWRVGVLVKYNANFWLLSLGSGGSGGAKTPTAPTLTKAQAGNKAVTLTWTAPTDDGGYGIRGYVVQSSTDQKVWTEAGKTTDPKILTFTVSNLSPATYYFRVLAYNEIGDGDPSNIMSASPLLPAPDVTHAGNGTFQIVAFDAGNAYKAVASVGTATINGTGLITCSSTDTIVTLTYTFKGTESTPVYFQRKKWTYHTEQQCHDVCHYAGWNCFHCGDAQCVGCQ